MSDSDDFVSSEDEASFSEGSDSDGAASNGDAFEEDPAALATFPQEPVVSSIEPLGEDSPEPEPRGAPLGKKGKLPAPRPRSRGTAAKALDSLAQVGLPESPVRPRGRVLVPDSEEKLASAEKEAPAAPAARKSKVVRRRVVALPPSQEEEDEAAAAALRVLPATGDAEEESETPGNRVLKASQATTASAEDTDDAGGRDQQPDQDRGKENAPADANASLPPSPGAAPKAQVAPQAAPQASPSAAPEAVLPSAALHSKPKPKPRATDPKSRVLDFMTRMNRPFSMPNVAEYLKKTVPKSVVARYLDDLCKGDVPVLKSKTYGKAVVYFLNQDTFDKKSLQPSRIAGLERDVDAGHAEVQAAKEQLAQVSTRLKRLREEPEDSALDALIADLQTSTAARRENAGRLQAMGPVDNDEKRKLVAKANKYRNVWRKRRRMAMDAVDIIADGMEKKPKEVLKLLDLETDADAGAVMPDPFT